MRQLSGCRVWSSDRFVCLCARAVLVKLPCWDTNMHCKTTTFVLMLRAGSRHWTILFKKSLLPMHLSMLTFLASHWCNNWLTTASISILYSVIFARTGQSKTFPQVSLAQIFVSHLSYLQVSCPFHGYLRAFLRWNILNGFTLSHF